MAVLVGGGGDGGGGVRLQPVSQPAATRLAAAIQTGPIADGRWKIINTGKEGLDMGIAPCGDAKETFQATTGRRRRQRFRGAGANFVLPVRGRPVKLRGEITGARSGCRQVTACVSETAGKPRRYAREATNRGRPVFDEKNLPPGFGLLMGG